MRKGAVRSPRPHGVRHIHFSQKWQLFHGKHSGKTPLFCEVRKQVSGDAVTPMLHYMPAFPVAFAVAFEIYVLEVEYCLVCISQVFGKVSRD